MTFLWFFADGEKVALIGEQIAHLSFWLTDAIKTQEGLQLETQRQLEDNAKSSNEETDYIILRMRLKRLQVTYIEINETWFIFFLIKINTRRVQ